MLTPVSSFGSQVLSGYTIGSNGPMTPLNGRSEGISVPGGLDSQGLPLGLQLIGRAFDEETLFKVAGVIESSADFKAKPEGF